MFGRYVERLEHDLRRSQTGHQAIPISDDAALNRVIEPQQEMTCANERFTSKCKALLAKSVCSSEEGANKTVLKHTPKTRASTP